MDPVTLTSIVGSVIRFLITGALSWLVAHQVLTSQQAGTVDTTTLSVTVAGLVITLLWGVWNKIHNRAKVKLALQNTNEQQVESAIKNSSFSQITRKALNQ